MSLNRVAITGLGAVSAFGIGVEALWQGVLAARCAIGPLHGIPPGRVVQPIAAQVPGYVEADHFVRKQSAMLDRVSQFAVVSAREAAAQAGLDAASFAALGRRAGAIHGASPGIATFDEGYAVLYGPSPTRVHPFTVPRVSAAGPACSVSIDLGAKGPCFGVASACASGTHAIGVAFDMVRTGKVDVCLGGGADASIVWGNMKAWEALRLMSRDTARPFSRDRSGLVLGEGAGTVVLERWDHAKARGATIIAELVGFGLTADAADMVAPDAESAAAAIQAAIEDAGLAPADIGYVNAHGTATRVNDRTESTALHAVFDGRVPPVSSLKSQIGHTLNAAGGLEVVVTALALRHQILPATANFREEDPECPVDCVPNAIRPARFTAAISNSFGFGGLNAVLALRAA